MQYIYKIVNTISEKFYIGRTHNIKLRWQKHLNLLEKGIHHSIHFQNAYNKYPKDSWEYVIHQTIDTGNDDDDLELAIEIEQEFLDRLIRINQLYNSSYSARTGSTEGELHPFFGMHPSEWMGDGYKEAMINKGKNMMGENNPFYGRHHSEETKEILRVKCANFGEDNGFYGKSHSEETKKILSEKASVRHMGEGNPFYGKKHSAETRKKISDSNKGRSRTVTEEEIIKRRTTNKRNIAITIDEVDYVSYTDAERKLGIGRKIIASRVKSEEYKNYSIK